jgi:hypothetical protein
VKHASQSGRLPCPRFMQQSPNKIQTLIVDSTGPADGINIEANPNAKAFSAVRGGLAH